MRKNLLPLIAVVSMLFFGITTITGCGAAKQSSSSTTASASQSAEKTVVLNVPTMGTLGSLLADYNMSSIEKLTLTGEINSDDFEVMKTKLPNLRDLDLANVDCEDNVIPEYAFGNNGSGKYSKAHRNLTTVILPKTVTVIERDAFSKCSNLTTVVFNEGLEAIKYLAFKDASIKGELKIPSTVTEIAGFAFNNCTGITSLQLNDVVKTISRDAFRGCSSIKGMVVFPSTLNSMGSAMFLECDKDLKYRVLREIRAGYPNLEKYEHPFPAGATIEVPEDLLSSYQEHDDWGSGRYNLVKVSE